MKIRKSSSESPKDHKSKKRRYSSAAESSECNADWSNEEVVSPASTSQFEFDSTPDHSGIPSKATKKDYSESILSLTDSPVPSTSCCISSPYPSENSRPDAEHSLSIVCEEEGIDLCKDYNLKYYESLDKFHQQQQQSLQANYCLLDYQFTVTYEHTGDEDLFSNMMSKNMVTVNMNEVQPEVKPHMEEEKRCEFEDFDADNNISGVVDGICRNLDSEINTVIEQIDQDGIDFDNSVEIITDSLLHDEIPLEDAVEIEIIQPVYTTGPSKTITTLADDTRSPVINEIVNDKVVVQKINVENVQVFQDDFLNSYDIVNEHKYEQKVPYITDLEKTPEKKRTRKSASPKEQEVPKKQITPEKTVNDSKSEINTHKKSGLNDKIKTAVNPKENKKPEKKKEEILPPSKFYKSSKSLDGKKIQKSTSSAEELFDLVKNSTIDNIKEPTHSIYIPRQAFNHASRKIQAEFKSQSRKRKPTDELIKPVIKQFKRGEKPVSTSDSSINQKDYKLFSVELDTSRITQANVFRSGSRRTSFSARVPNKENSSMQKKQPKKSNGDEKKSIGVAKKKDTWLDNPVIKANLARFEQVKKM